MNILCIIPARSGSKGIPDKNIKKFHGKPLLAWSIIQAIKCKYKMKIIVSTDSEKYAKIAREYGAEVPFLRPKEISDDLSTDLEFLKYTVETLELLHYYKTDIVLQLRPTAPNRTIKNINNCLDQFIKNFDNYDSLRTVSEVEKSPYKMYNLSIEDNRLIPLFDNFNGIRESFNQPRQIFTKSYIHNGYIDILKTDILKDNLISGNKIYPFIMDKSDKIDIDHEEDWINAEKNFIPP